MTRDFSISAPLAALRFVRRQVLSLSTRIMFFGGLNDPSEKLRKEQKKEMEKRSKATAARGRLREGEQQRETNRNTNAETKTKSKKKEKRYEVLWKAELRVRVEDVALKRGIRTRREDKIQLPASALRMLERFDDEMGARQPNGFFTFRESMKTKMKTKDVTARHWITKRRKIPWSFQQTCIRD